MGLLFFPRGCFWNLLFFCKICLSVKGVNTGCLSVVHPHWDMKSTKQLKHFLWLDGMMMWKQSRKYIFRGSWHVVDVSTLGARDRNKKKNGTGVLSNRAHGLFYPRYHCTKNWIYTNLLGANIVQKSANEEEVKIKDGKYCICITVYMR